MSVLDSAYALVPGNFVAADAHGYRVRTLPPFRSFRGLEIPWDDNAELQRIAEAVPKSSRSRKVVKLCAGQFGTPIELFVKRYTFKTWLSHVLRVGRKSRAREEFELGWKLLDQGIPTPRPVWLAEAKGAVPRVSLIATEGLPDAESALHRWRAHPQEKPRAALLTSVGHFTRRLHEAGFYHDDYRAGHLLLPAGKAAHDGRFFVIDLLGGRFSSALSDERRARNLYQMLRSFIPRRSSEHIPEPVRDAFLEAYCSHAEAHAWSKWLERLGRKKGRQV